MIKRTKHREVQERFIRERLVYDPESGIFSWSEGYLLHQRRGRKPKATPGAPQSEGYLRFNIADGRRMVGLLAHRAAWFIMTGKWPRSVIDHINGDKLDNRFANLRSVTVRANLCNNKAVREGQKLAGCGFHKRFGKWQAFIRIKGRYVHLGYSDTEEAAHQKYIDALKKHGFNVTLQVVTGEKTPCRK